MEKKQLYAAGQAIIPHSGYDENENELLRKSEIAPWAKAEKKPSYSAAEVGADVEGSADGALASAKTYADNTYMQATGYTDQAIADLIGGAPTTLDTLKEIADAIEKNENVVVALDEAIGSKASEAEFQSHDANKTVHITASERNKWNKSCEDISSTRNEVENINNGLKANDATFNLDYQNGQWGWNENPARGADTFHPFRSGESSGSVYFKKGTSANFTDIITSLGKKVTDFNSSNFRYVLSAGGSVSGGIFKTNGNGYITIKSFSDVISVSYSNGVITASGYDKVTATSVGNQPFTMSGIGSGLSSCIRSAYTILGFIFDPSDTPFAR